MKKLNHIVIGCSIVLIFIISYGAISYVVNTKKELTDIKQEQSSIVINLHAINNFISTAMPDQVKAFNARVDSAKPPAK